MTEKDVTVVNTSDADMVAAYKTDDVTSVVTWNPLVSTILEEPSAKKVFDSSQIPGEIIDLMVANTAVLKDNPDFGKALAGIWYETTALMMKDTAEGKAAREEMGKAPAPISKASTASLRRPNCSTSPLTPVPSRLLPISRNHGSGAQLPVRERPARQWRAVCRRDRHRMPDGKALGDKGNVKFRFTTTYMDAAAKGL